MNKLAAIETSLLLEALDDEYRSWATYDQVIADFGPVQPFVNIRDAEARHIQALGRLFARYALPMPANTWLGRVEHAPSLHAACKTAAAAEIANGEMYARLSGQTRRSDILAVLRNLQEASQQRHLPAFLRDAQNGSCGGGGSGGDGGSGAGAGRGSGRGSGRRHLSS